MFFKRKNKILVEIIEANHVKKRKKYEIDGDTVVIEKGAKGRGLKGWAPTFSGGCKLTFRGGFPFKSLKEKLTVMEGADECVDWSKNPLDIPYYNFATAKHLFKASVLEKAGHLKTKLDVPLGVYLLLGGILIISIITLLISSGRVRFV